MVSSRASDMADDALLEELLADAEHAVCAGAAIEAIAAAAKAAEAWLKRVLGVSASERRMLGDLLGEAHAKKALAAGANKALNQLNVIRNEALHFRGGRGALDIDTARKAVDALAAALEQAGALSASRRREVARRAHRRAARHAPEEVRFHLDRTEQKGQLGSLLIPEASVVMFCAHGESEQGHDDLCALAGWRVREDLRGRWTRIEPRWPPPGAALGTRFAALVAALAEAATGREPPLPELDPIAEPDVWEPAIAAIAESMAAYDHNWFVEHLVSRPSSEDAELVALYCDRVLAVLARALVGYCVVGLKVERMEAGGLPLISRGWWLSWRDRRQVRRLVSRFDAHGQSPGVAYMTLAELASVPEPDLVGWLTRWAKLDPRTATERARELIARSRGGRWNHLTRSLDVEAPRTRRR